MLISHYEHLVEVEGMPWGLDAALRGASEHLAPIWMTALATGLGLLPLAIGSGDPGREIEGPMATVILGGLVTSTLLNLLVLLRLALRYARFDPRQAFSGGSKMINRIECTLFAFAIGWLCVSPLTAASSDSRKIDGPHSTVTVRVYKSGFLSAFGHNHEIRGPIQSGEMQEADSPSVELRVDARKLRVLDPEVSEATRTQIQDTMHGVQVLDVAHFPEIRFQSTAVDAKGPDLWIVHGNLTLHGKDRPVAVEVTLKGEHYRGSATLKQTDFGMTPVTVAGGTVKVKDEVKIEFEIALIK